MIDGESSATTGLSTEVGHQASEGRGGTASLADRLRRGTMLVALSGEPNARGAIAVARAIEHRYRPTIVALRVLNASTSVPAASGPNDWSVHFQVGDVADAILEYAKRYRVALITMGLRRHVPVDRLLRDKTTITVASRSPVPVLAVVTELCGLPRRAVVGVDFGPASLGAAQAALDLVARPVSRGSAILRLAYVERSPAAHASAGPGQALVGQLGVQSAFEELIGDLDAPAYVRVDSSVLYGSVACELLRLAAESEADLIAVGSPRPTRADRQTLDSVSDVFRDGRFSVLAVPLTDVTPPVRL